MPARQHEPHPHPAPHHPRPSAHGSRALGPSLVCSGAGTIGAGKVEVDLFPETLYDDMEEREEGEVSRRDDRAHTLRTLCHIE